jgi:hypothetical protein
MELNRQVGGKAKRRPSKALTSNSDSVQKNRRNKMTKEMGIRKVWKVTDWIEGYADLVGIFTTKKMADEQARMRRIDTDGECDITVMRLPIMERNIIQGENGEEIYVEMDDKDEYEEVIITIDAFN